MYTPRTSVEAIPNASIHHSALQNRDFGHTYDRSRALVKALECCILKYSNRILNELSVTTPTNAATDPIKRGTRCRHLCVL